MLQLSPEVALRHQVSLEKRLKKLVLVLATSMPMIETKVEAVETAKTAKTFEIAKTAKAIEITGTDKDGKENKGSENPRSNLAQVLCI